MKEPVKNSLKTLYKDNFTDLVQKEETKVEIPSATPENMMVLVRKINELINEVNNLKYK